MCILRERRSIALIRFLRRYIQKKLRTRIARAHIFRRIIVKHLYGKFVFVEKSLSLWLDPLFWTPSSHTFSRLLQLSFSSSPFPISAGWLILAYPLNFVHFFRKVCDWFHFFWSYHTTFLLPLYQNSCKGLYILPPFSTQLILVGLSSYYHFTEVGLLKVTMIWVLLGKKDWKCQSLSWVWLFVTPWTIAHQASLFIEFFRRQY